ncbi:alpha-2-macroglobulin family protein [Ancylobacter defluvii]|uniref:Alpha-2-macroglobulin n=1 Tax=Ancylobacter defluvii TaxID=1282440 RepID=A0A9W6NCU6_9HYPH|nr:alpha-2-macroglobulin [Ancylobacter defluvii]MBS7586721.1 alpha-2-macroglobulin family protein [Ancylobacter defluvii]GLK86022.1 alpha-2-macroglobulin [Ancylobacter defluvii]
MSAAVRPATLVRAFAAPLVLAFLAGAALAQGAPPKPPAPLPKSPVTAPATAPVTAPAKPAVSQPAAAQPAAEPALPKTYSRPDLVESARRLQALVDRNRAPLEKPAAQLRRDADAALQAGDARSAADLYARLVRLAPDDSGLWMRLSRALAKIKPNNDESADTFLDRATAAAFLAYRRATTRNQQADALYAIGHLYAERSLWRAALDTLNLALVVRDVPAERSYYDSLRAEQGFRMLDYTVDSEAANPRACVQFSEELAKGPVDFASFVALSGPGGAVDKPAVSVDGQQLCVEGLRHGEAYGLTIRAGLPSVIAAEKLQKAADLTIYVRDRKPGVRFTGRAYVLPRTGPRSIPVVTVNTSRVAVEVLRVSDRSLIPTALDGDFRRDLGSYDLSQLKDGQAELVFSGELETASPLNEDTTTAFPVDEAVGTLKPGVYVLAARPGGDAANPDDDYATRSAQWFVVSDLGMTALSGSDGLHVLVRALGSARPVANAEIRLLAKSNELLATARTDANGAALFDAAITRGTEGFAPAVVVARGEADDYAFLSLEDQAFDLTDRGVGGRAAPGRMDAFLTAERGVYRSGETVHLTALLRNPQVAAVAGVPLTLVLKRPDGVEDRRALVDDQGAGGRATAFELMAGAMTGTWRVDAYVDPRGAPVGSTTFLVEDYVPERLALELSTTAKQIAPGTPITVDVLGRWLFGPPATGLDVSGEIELKVAKERAGWPGWRFGRADDGFTAQREPLPEARVTDAAGKASLAAVLPSAPATGQPLEAEIFVELDEGGGRAIRRSLTLPVAPAGSGLGVKPLWSGSGPAEGTSAAVEVAFIDAGGKQQPAAGVAWTLYRIENRYQWYRVGNSWDFEPVQATRKVADGTLDLAADQPRRLEVPVEWGRYRLEVTSGAGATRLSTAVGFEAGWGGGATADAPDRLDLTLDKPLYAAGDKLNVHMASRTAGSATVLIVGDGVLAMRTLDVPAGDSTVTFDVAANWAPGAYALAFLHRPLDVAAGRNPGRAIGLAWFGVDRAKRVLEVALAAPERIRPETTLSVPVEVKGAGAGEAYVTLALVDVGILNLTGFKTPDPDGFYLGQRQLGTQVRDFYGQLIDGMQGARGRLRSGGDAMDGGLQADPPTQPPLALFSGPVKLDGQGRATIDFAVPAFDGTGKLMAVAWSGEAVGHGDRDVVIRDPVVATTTLPRFLGAGDRSTLNLALDNVDGPAGDYTLSLVTEGPVKFGAAPARVTLAQGARQSLQVPLEGTGIGPAKVSVRLGGPDGLGVVRDYALEVRPAYPSISRRSVTALAPGASLTLSGDLVADLVPGTGRVTVSAGGDPAFDVPALMVALDRYPFACSEQLTSRAMPLLYAAELAKGLDLKNDPDKTIRDAIARLVARQGSDGSFGLWQAGGNDLFLDAYVSDFLTRARERGFAVPEVPFRLALDRLRNALSYAGDGATDDGTAYAIYVLARNGRAPLGDLRYVADAKMADVSSPFARGNIAAALGLLGDKGRAEKAFAAALELLPAQPEADLLGRADFGSQLRDAAGVATLAAEGGFPGTARTARARAVTLGNESGPTSTQEDAWLLLAARAAREGRGVSLDIDGSAHSGLFERIFEPSALTAHRTILTNRGSAPVDVAVSIDGPPSSPEPAAASGFALKRSYFDLAGNPADPSKVQQNQSLVVVLEAQEDEYAPSQVLLVDWLPAGFEIDNPALAVGSDAGALSWLGETTEAAHAEFRDTHFMAAFDRTQASEESKLLRVAYIVRAVSPGTYAHPPATVEDMYRPGRFARTGAGTSVVTERGR